MEFPNLAQIESMLADAGTLFDRAQALGTELRVILFVGYGDDKRISATVDGFGSLREVGIETYAKRELDIFTLGECVAQAINRALTAAREGREAALGTLTLNGQPITDIVQRYSLERAAFARSPRSGSSSR